MIALSTGRPANSHYQWSEKLFGKPSCVRQRFRLNYTEISISLIKVMAAAKPEMFNPSRPL